MNSLPQQHPLPIEEPRRPRNLRSGRLLVVLLAMLFPALAPWLILACGPFFPNSLLPGGDKAVLQAPEVIFSRELDRLQLEPPPGLPRFESKDAEHHGTAFADVADVQRALEVAWGPRLRSGEMSTNEVANWLQGYREQRDLVEKHRSAMTAWQAAPEAGPRPTPPTLEPPATIPAEFVIYLQGALAWHDGQTNAARAKWQALLALPIGQRAYRSTWAAYMLGRSWHEETPERAQDFYQRTRRLARSGLADNLGLSIASLGWEAQLRVRTNDLAGALRLYLDQYAAGERPSALSSLGLVARRVLNAPPEQRLALARVRVFRHLLTAWVLSNESWRESWNVDADDSAWSLATRWLETIESVGAAEVPLAEQLALLCYKAGKWKAAADWVELAGGSPAAEWVRAKLLLRDGEFSAAARAYANALSRLPHEASPAKPVVPPPFTDSLVIPEHEWVEPIPPKREILGELGVVRLSRGDFEQALDALLRAGFWQDAAYVAERVLTLDELRAYVDREWPILLGRDAEDEARLPEGDASRRTQRERIRYLLARRLTRQHHGREAGPYYPDPWRDAQVRLMNWLETGRNPTLTVAERATALSAAAWLARTNGLELLGTEVGPDWAIWGGSYEGGNSPETRAAQRDQRLAPTEEEIQRAGRHQADPEMRFHYRYQAALLAWEATGLMPDNDPQTARLLYDAGCWLKARDPKTADIFYKALVRRCRRTELGDAADRQRWFPPLDADGRPYVTRIASPPSPEESSPDQGETVVNPGPEDRPDA